MGLTMAGILSQMADDALALPDGAAWRTWLAEHHGDSDSSLSARWVSPRNRRNKIGRPYFRELATFKETVLTILSESGHDLATQLMPTYAKQRERLRPRRVGRAPTTAAARSGLAAVPARGPQVATCVPRNYQAPHARAPAAPGTATIGEAE